MLNRSKRTMAVAIVSSAALIGASIPSYAHSARYCRDQAERAARSNNDAWMMILPLAAVGAGAGALVGVAAAGISVGTGAIVGTGIGAGAGTANAVVHSGGGSSYDQAYAQCRSAS